jgi:NAD+ diphosphatase
MVLTSGLAAQLYRWNNSHKFCGQCGGLTEDKADERAKVCLKCDLIYFPRLSPAVIVAVIKDKKILLARSGRFPYGFYSVLAGFVQPGETLEECVAREVYEEVGIVVKNIRYFDSQPWPFPDSLMLGFTAEYASGDIYVDQSEIADAGWFGAFNMPNIPPKISIARQLIDWYVDNFK